jgi:hypothetical protein
VLIDKVEKLPDWLELDLSALFVSNGISLLPGLAKI